MDGNMDGDMGTWGWGHGDVDEETRMRTWMGTRGWGHEVPEVDTGKARVQGGNRAGEGHG